jgi:DNA polymerase-3 subunit gamma/tau
VARTKATNATADDATLPSADRDPAHYTVVARRYRPQRFEDVVGQDHVVQALRNAVRLNRVTHAYLFSGTRGVGKTSIARIFAKCLNCVRGPTDDPCLKCDICQAIAAGQDVDVIEIDGASNNGVEAVRELRQNAGLRPSRSRFKIYYIDEVHMLSTGAFNALLKTLEEPPEHVKFFFATTEPNKIPITVLSRCQRYDFVGILPEEIVATLAAICQREHVEADDEALQVVARRAAGSMRDAQSLLEQLLSFGAARLTADLVHQALRIAPDERVLDLVEALADHDAARVLTLVHSSTASGVQPADLLTGVLEFLRDVMVLAAAPDVPTLAVGPAQRGQLQAVAGRWPLDSVLAAMQILAEARGRLRGSPYGRLLVEMALCRVARLENFTALSELLGCLTGLEGGNGAPGAKKKLTDRDERTPPPRDPVLAATRAYRPARDAGGTAGTPERRENAPAQTGGLDVETFEALWPRLLEHVGAGLGVPLSRVKPTAFELPGVLVIRLPSGYNWVADKCDQSESRARIEASLHALLQQPVSVRFDRAEPDETPQLPATPAVTARMDELAADPLVKQVVDLFEARRVRIDLEEDRPEA